MSNLAKMLSKMLWWATTPESLVACLAELQPQIQSHKEQSQEPEEITNKRKADILDALIEQAVVVRRGESE